MWWGGWSGLCGMGLGRVGLGWIGLNVVVFKTENVDATQIK